MAEQRGGYRRPGKPAAVSGPGKASRRTDGQPSADNMKQAKRYVSGMAYGENKELNEIQAQGDLAAGPDPTNVGAPAVNVQQPVRASGGSGLNLSNLVPLDADSVRPDEPVSAGAARGAGAGLEAIPGTPEYQLSENEKSQVALLYGLLERAASRPNASRSVIEMARKVRSIL